MVLVVVRSCLTWVLLHVVTLHRIAIAYLEILYIIITVAPDLALIHEYKRGAGII